MKFVPFLCDFELQALMDAYRQGEKLTLPSHAHAILPSHKGYTLNQISDILVIISATVSLWLVVVNQSRTRR
ncbi:hypothetical protein [Pseudomonas brassicacearum]|uniref:hypothetical protein n=1 Tax=Pseudomonas brassicacearum TaxID=930166 RepID=UPI0011CE49FC|nr:hypothetical protein [Pseudomonas brassicacearum]